VHRRIRNPLPRLSAAVRASTRGLEAELAFAAEKGKFDVVPVLRDGVLRAV
jgi:phosphosulfolactate phosphohydrolase-like enzyme